MTRIFGLGFLASFYGIYATYGASPTAAATSATSAALAASAASKMTVINQFKQSGSSAVPGVGRSVNGNVRVITMKTACVGPSYTAARRAIYHTLSIYYTLAIYLASQPSGTWYSTALGTRLFGCSGTHVYLHTINYVRTGLSALFKHSSRAASQSQCSSSGLAWTGLAWLLLALISHLVPCNNF